MAGGGKRTKCAVVVNGFFFLTGARAREDAREGDSSRVHHGVHTENVTETCRVQTH